MKYSKLRCADFLHEGQLVSVEVADMPSAPCQTISNQPPPARGSRACPTRGSRRRLSLSPSLLCQGLARTVHVLRSKYQCVCICLGVGWAGARVAPLKIKSKLPRDQMFKANQPQSIVQWSACNAGPLKQTMLSMPYLHKTYEDVQ